MKNFNVAEELYRFFSFNINMGHPPQSKHEGVIQDYAPQADLIHLQRVVWQDFKNFNWFDGFQSFAFAPANPGFGATLGQVITGLEQPEPHPETVGVLTLSQSPLAEVEAWTLPHSDLAESHQLYQGFTVLKSKVELNGASFISLNCLPAFPEMAIEEKHWKDQMLFLQSRLAEISEPLLCSGDFHVDPQIQIWDSINFEFEDVWTTCGEGNSDTFNQQDSQWNRLDRIFINNMDSLRPQRCFTTPHKFPEMNHNVLGCEFNLM